MSGDIFAGQPSDPDLLAEIYDLEHDAVTEDLAFYRQMARRHRRIVLDVGCGSGRLFPSLLAGGAERVVGIDPTPALLRRARSRISASPELASAEADGRLVLVEGDARRIGRRHIRQVVGGPASLVIVAGVLPHLDGPDDALRFLQAIRSMLDRRGVAILDDLGPGQLPRRDLPLSLDWRRVSEGTEFVRRSQLMVREAPEGLRVVFSTIVDVGRPDGTIARLPASHRLWYPSHDALRSLVREAGMVEELAYGSHDLDPLGEDSDRRILVVRTAVETGKNRLRRPRAGG